jgi:hypothetical protein
MFILPLVDTEDSADPRFRGPCHSGNKLLLDD